jgi:hypothetical protein
MICHPSKKGRKIIIKWKVSKEEEERENKWQ